MSRFLVIILFNVKPFSSQTGFVRLNQLDAIGVFFALHDDAFIPRFLCIRTAATYRLSSLDAYLLFRLLLGEYKRMRKVCDSYIRAAFQAKHSRRFI